MAHAYLREGEGISESISHHVLLTWNGVGITLASVVVDARNSRQKDGARSVYCGLRNAR